jgi:hypothetical protein
LTPESPLVSRYDAGMERLSWLAAAALALLLAGHAQAADAALDRAAWLAGCWRADNAEPGSGEQWLAPAGGTMLGVGRTVRRGVTQGYEFMQIRPGADGRLVFAAQPQGRAETLFTLLPGTGSELVFENPEHDFPQRVIYRPEPAGRLRARIEGQRDGLPRAVDFAMTRTPCDPPSGAPEAFQGLPWGASETLITMRFGPALKAAECTAVLRAEAQRRGEACDHPQLAAYEVAGLPFRLNLHLDAVARQLVRVSLVSATETAAPETDWSDKHRQLRRLLTQRYGGPEATHVDSDSSLSTASARWRRGDTMIELSSTFRPRQASQPTREHVEIVYQPVTAGDAGKL